MTIGADNLTLSDFLLQSFVRKKNNSSDRILLTSTYVIKLHNVGWIPETAISARNSFKCVEPSPLSRVTPF